MLYQSRTFTVPAGAGTGVMCQEKGHSAVDAKGRCLCCGEKTATTAIEQAASVESDACVQADTEPLSPPGQCRSRPSSH